MKVVGKRIVKISGLNSDGRVDVFWDITVPAVTNSAFYNTGFWDAFIGYNHLSGSAYKSGNKINFTANGEIILKIIWQGVELKSYLRIVVGIMILIKKYNGN